MDHLTDLALAQRARDIYLNAQLGTPSHVLVDRPPMGWNYLWRDVVDEAYRRFGDAVVKGFVQEVKGSCTAAWRSRPRLIPEISRDQLPDFIRRADVEGRPFLVRYSKRKWLEPLLKRGELLIFPASRYDDPSLNPAVRDNELELAIQPHGLTGHVLDPTGKPKGSFRVIDNRFTSRLPTNYYVHCLSRVLSPELFPEFDADACIIIRDPKVYASRVLDACNAVLPHPTWGGDIEKVKYVDPLRTSIRQSRVATSKHFRFAYQQEWRIIWFPAYDVCDLTPLQLEMGSMEDCCALLVP